MCHQQHFAVFPSADLFDDVEVLLDLQLTEALRCQLHQLVDQAAVSEAQLNHLYPYSNRIKRFRLVFTNLRSTSSIYTTHTLKTYKYTTFNGANGLLAAGSLYLIHMMMMCSFCDFLLCSSWPLVLSQMGATPTLTAVGVRYLQLTIYWCILLINCITLKFNGQLFSIYSNCSLSQCWLMKSRDSFETVRTDYFYYCPKLMLRHSHTLHTMIGWCEDWTSKHSSTDFFLYLSFSCWAPLFTFHTNSVINVIF